MADGPEAPFVLSRGQTWEGPWCLSVAPTRAVAVEVRSELPAFSSLLRKGSRDAELGSTVSRGQQPPD